MSNSIFILLICVIIISIFLTYAILRFCDLVTYVGNISNNINLLVGKKVIKKQLKSNAKKKRK